MRDVLTAETSWLDAAGAEEPADDAALVEQAQSDSQAFALLYRRYVDPIYRYCWYRLGSREEAEDAASQVFTQALAALPRCRPSRFRSWLFTIAHNVVTDRYRARHPSWPLEMASVLADPAPTPEDWAVAHDQSRTLRRVLLELPPDQRRVVELRLAGLRDAEIARVLGRSHGAVRSLQFRAVTRLREQLVPESKKEVRDVQET